jgi:hypothetical protein
MVISRSLRQALLSPCLRCPSTGRISESMSRRARCSMPGSSGVRSASALRCSRATAASWLVCPKVNSRKKIPSVEGAYASSNTQGVPQARSTLKLSTLSAPHIMAAMIVVSLPAGLTAPEAGSIGIKIYLRSIIKSAPFPPPSTSRRKENPQPTPELPHGVETFTWPPVDTTSWPLTARSVLRGNLRRISRRAGMTPTTRRFDDGTQFILNGAKTFITGRKLADPVIVCARTDPRHATIASRCSWWRVPQRTRGSAESRGAPLAVRSNPVPRAPKLGGRDCSRQLRRSGVIVEDPEPGKLTPGP